MSDRPIPDSSLDWPRGEGEVWTLGAGDLVRAGGLFLLLFLVYAPALNGTRLLDDVFHLTSPEVRTWDGLRRIWLQPGATQQYYPLLHTAFWLQGKIWGDVLWPYFIALS